MSKRTLVLSCLLITVLLITGPTRAQQSKKLPRIGFLSGSFPGSTRGVASIQKELHILGYVEGKSIAYEYRYAENNSERSPALAQELIRLNVDIVVGAGPNDSLAAKKVTKTIPIVFIDSPSDPVKLGLVDSLARPGGNVTGFFSMAEVLAGKRLEVLKESIEKLSRVAILWYPDVASNTQWTESQVAARQLGLQLYSMEMRSTKNYESGFKEAIKAGSTALGVTRHRLTQSSPNQKQIIELAAKYRLPAIYYRKDFVEQGGLMAYGADEVEPFKRVATMVDKILKGEKPADIPVEQSTKFEFIVNAKTAKQIGLTIPPSVLARADRVIK